MVYRMNTTKRIAVIFVFSLTVIQAQYYGRMRGLSNVHKDPILCTCEDLMSLISLSRSLEEKENISTPASNNVPYLSNFEELLMKLVNALVYTTTQVAQNKCHCSHTETSGASSSSNSYSGHGNTVPATSYNSGHPHSDGGLVDLNLLNSNKKDNVLDLDVGKAHLLGVSLGGRDGQQTSSTNAGRQDNNNSGGLVNLDVLSTNKKNNVANVGLGNQNVLGVGLGGGGTDSGSNYSQYNKNNENNTGEGLVNLNVLNANKNGNVADLDVGNQHVLGLGIGN